VPAKPIVHPFAIGHVEAAWEPALRRDPPDPALTGRLRAVASPGRELTAKRPCNERVQCRARLRRVFLRLHEEIVRKVDRGLHGAPILSEDGARERRADKLLERVHSGAGLIALLAIAWLIGRGDARQALRVAAAGAGMQLALTALLLWLPPAQHAFAAANGLVLALQDATRAGTSFVFGYLGGAPEPFESRGPGTSFVLAFQALPLILVVSALSALLTYWRVLPWLVRAFALVLERSLGVGGAVGLAAAANVFVGMVEAPLFVRAYLARLSRSELFVLMCTGMATIAGTVLVLYASFLAEVVPEAAGHLITASLISAPAAIAIAMLMVPPGEQRTGADFVPERGADGALDAITRGTQSGVALLVNVVAMLLVLVALVHLANAGLALLPDVAGSALTLERALGWAMAPLAWLMGVPWSEAPLAGSLLGTKTVLNELLAYLRLAELPPEALSPRSRLVMTYALCGFANLGSLGILIGGLATMVPERRAEIVALGPWSVVGGTLATCCTGAVVGLLGSVD